MVAPRGRGVRAINACLASEYRDELSDSKSKNSNRCAIKAVKVCDDNQVHLRVFFFGSSDSESDSNGSSAAAFRFSLGPVFALILDTGFSGGASADAVGAASALGDVATLASAEISLKYSSFRAYDRC